MGTRLMLAVFACLVTVAQAPDPLGVVAVAGLMLGAWTQDPPIALRNIETIDTTSLIPGEALLIKGSPVCDRDANVFLMPSSGAGDPPRRILRISSDGKQATWLDLGLLPGYEEEIFYSMVAGPDGHLYALTLGPKGQRILEFSERGKLEAVTPFDRKQIYVKRIAVFDADAFLVEGVSGEQPAIAVFSRSGEVVKRVSLDRTDSKAQPTEGRFGADLGHMVSAGDGNIYVVKWTPRKGMAIGISRSGEIVTRIALTPPDGAQTLTSVKAFKNRMVVEYTRTDASGEFGWWMSVYDLSSGQKVADYVPPNAGGGLLCYTSSEVAGDVFTLLGMSSHGLVQLVRVGR